MKIAGHDTTINNKKNFSVKFRITQKPLRTSQNIVKVLETVSLAIPLRSDKIILANRITMLCCYSFLTMLKHRKVLKNVLDPLFRSKVLSPSRRTKQPFSICKYLSLQLFTDSLQRQLTTQKASKMFWNRTTQIRKEHTYLFLHASTRSPAMIERSLSIMKDFSPPLFENFPPQIFFIFLIFFYLL